jgi:hypothetical protein
MKANAVFLPAFLPLFVMTCNEVPAGGPCTYDEWKVPARIIKIDTLNANELDVVFLLDSNEWVPPPADTISYFMEKGEFLTRSEADSLHLVIGRAFTYLIMQLRTGSCNPDIRQLVMEPMP